MEDAALRISDPTRAIARRTHVVHKCNAAYLNCLVDHNFNTSAKFSGYTVYNLSKWFKEIEERLYISFPTSVHNSNERNFSMNYLKFELIC